MDFGQKKSLPNYSKERQNSGNRAACGCCPCQDYSIGMPTLHIGQAVSEKTGTVIKGFSFIVMGDLGMRVCYNGCVMHNARQSRFRPFRTSEIKVRGARHGLILVY